MVDAQLYRELDGRRDFSAFKMLYGFLPETVQRILWKAVGWETGWKAGRCRHVQISELFSLEICDQAVLDFLVATEVGKFPRR